MSHLFVTNTRKFFCNLLLNLALTCEFMMLQSVCVCVCGIHSFHKVHDFEHMRSKPMLPHDFFPHPVTTAHRHTHKKRWGEGVHGGEGGGDCHYHSLQTAPVCPAVLLGSQSDECVCAPVTTHVFMCVRVWRSASHHTYTWKDHRFE